MKNSKYTMNNEKGFTLIEALVGSLILAIGAVVICGLSYRCMINNKRGLEYEQACRLLDECLDRVVAVQLAELIRTKRIEDDFGDRHPNYSFVLETAQVENSQLHRVTATVRWMVGKQQYQVQATTLLYPLEQREEMEITRKFTVNNLQLTARKTDKFTYGN